MAHTIAFVTGIQPDGRATVVAEKGQGCGSCGAAVQCHGGRTAQSQETTALNHAGAKVGDRVTLTIASGVLLSRMAVLYLVPVAGMLIGAFSGASAGSGPGASGDSHSILMGLAGFIGGFALSVVISRIWSARSPVQPIISRVINLNRGPAPRAGTPVSGCGGTGR